jgi:hypothetical protein
MEMTNIKRGEKVKLLPFPLTKVFLYRDRLQFSVLSGLSHSSHSWLFSLWVSIANILQATPLRI